MKPLTDNHYFENTEESKITPIQTKNTSPKPLEGKLLLVIQWDHMTEFIYETHSVLTQPQVVEVQPYPEREDKTPEEICEEYIQLDKQHREGQISETKPQIQKILACNPDAYSVEEITSQYI